MLVLLLVGCVVALVALAALVTRSRRSEDPRRRALVTGTGVLLGGALVFLSGFVSSAVLCP